MVPNCKPTWQDGRRCQQHKEEEDMAHLLLFDEKTKCNVQNE